jgi:hypothetical protein
MQISMDGSSSSQQTLSLISDFTLIRRKLGKYLRVPRFARLANDSISSKFEFEEACVRAASEGLTFAQLKDATVHDIHKLMVRCHEESREVHFLSLLLHKAASGQKGV